MKSLFPLGLTALVLVAALVYFRRAPERPAPTLAVPQAAAPGERSPAPTGIQSPAPKAMANSDGGTVYLPRQPIAGLHLAPLELAAWEKLAQETHADVMRAFAHHAQIEKVADNHVIAHVKLTDEQFDALRAAFYARISFTLGEEKFGAFLRSPRRTALEGRFSWFGEFPVTFDFTGDGSTLAWSSRITYQEKYEQYDELGAFTSFPWGFCDLAEFQTGHGALAEKVLFPN